MPERADFEPRDVPPVRVLAVGLALAAGVGLAAVLLLGLSSLLTATVEAPPPGPLAALKRTTPAPRLQADPGLELETLQARWQLDLESYGWIDREAGIVRIPIERAMTLLVERGWPNPVTGGSASEAPPASSGSAR